VWSIIYLSLFERVWFVSGVSGFLVFLILYSMGIEPGLAGGGSVLGDSGGGPRHDTISCAMEVSAVFTVA